jgi:hypothetical protein
MVRSEKLVSGYNFTNFAAHESMPAKDGAGRDASPWRSPPSKKFDPYYSLIKGAHLGPHQHVKKLALPGEPEIRTLAQNGYDLVVGMANRRPGRTNPLLVEAGLPC